MQRNMDDMGCACGFKIVFTLGRHRRRWVLSSFIASVRPYVRTERRYRSNSLMISAISLKFSRMLHSTMVQIAIENGYAPSIFQGTLKISMMSFLDQVGGTTLPLKLFKDFCYWPEIWWDRAQYHGADRYL